MRRRCNASSSSLQFLGNWEHIRKFKISRHVLPPSGSAGWAYRIHGHVRPVPSPLLVHDPPHVEVEHVRMHARIREPYWNADAATGLASSGSQPAARETSRGGARPRLPAQEPRAPFGCYRRAISLIVFRCMRGMCCAPWRAGRERATSGRPAIGGRGSAWPTHAARARRVGGRGAARGARRRARSAAAGWLLRRPQGSGEAGCAACVDWS